MTQTATTKTSSPTTDAPTESTGSPSAGDYGTREDTTFDNDAPTVLAPVTQSQFATQEEYAAFQEFQAQKARQEAVAKAVTNEPTPTSTTADEYAGLSDPVKVFQLIRDFLSHKFGPDIGLLDNAFSQHFGEKTPSK